MAFIPGYIEDDIKTTNVVENHQDQTKSDQNEYLKTFQDKEPYFVHSEGFDDKHPKDGIKCRQMYLRSYTFNKKEGFVEKTTNCFGRLIRPKFGNRLKRTKGKRLRVKKLKRKNKNKNKCCCPRLDGVKDAAKTTLLSIFCRMVCWMKKAEHQASSHSR